MLGIHNVLQFKTGTALKIINAYLHCIWPNVKLRGLPAFGQVPLECRVRLFATKPDRTPHYDCFKQRTINHRTETPSALKITLGVTACVAPHTDLMRKL